MAGEAVFESVANWFRTLRLVVFDRRALLLGAPPPTPPPVPPLKFMLSAAALLYGVNAIVALQAPAIELPGSVSMLRQLVGLVSDLPSALTFGGALLSAVMLFAFFRLFRIPLSWEAIWRQVAGELLPREAVTQTVGERPDPNRPEFYEHIGERRFIVLAGKNDAPVACLSAVAQRVPDGMFLVAADERPDGQGSAAWSRGRAYAGSWTGMRGRGRCRKEGASVGDLFHIWRELAGSGMAILELARARTNLSYRRSSHWTRLFTHH